MNTVTGHIVLVVSLPDRPGALGAVASRLGAIGADITDVRVARRHGAGVDDTFHLDLPDTGHDLVALIHAELGEVDGVTVTGWHTASGCCDTFGP